ncbi:MAG: hypothetical protein LBH13_10470 [Cellulomonadaceae bacterium]|jgi:hypothetical protein|nr:hypothetical protein [Cellulomonadaceae bacterium]
MALSEQVRRSRVVAAVVGTLTVVVLTLLVVESIRRPEWGTAITDGTLILAAVTVIATTTLNTLAHGQRNRFDRRRADVEDRKDWYERVKDAKEDLFSGSVDRQKAGRQLLRLHSHSALAGSTEVGITKAILSAKFDEDEE